MPDLETPSWSIAGLSVATVPQEYAYASKKGKSRDGGQSRRGVILHPSEKFRVSRLCGEDDLSIV